MGSLNVNRSVSDVFYRYKMPRLMAKVEGKGNGIKTVIVNMAEVAKALGRPPTYPTKYFGCELGAQTQFDFKNERFIVNGSHDAGKLQDLLDGFIRKFVLCPECDNPETELLVATKRSTISQGCKACGYHGALESNHKLVTFILKNPPNLNPAVQGSSLTEGKRSKRSKRTKPGEQNGDANCGGNGNGNGGGEEETSVLDCSSSVVGGEGGGNNSNKNNSSETATDDATEWSADVSEEAVRARMQDLTEGAKNITINDDLEKTEKERMDIFYELVKTKRDAKMLEKPQVCTELVNEAERLEIKQKAPLVLCELLLDQNMLNQLRGYRNLFVRFTHDDSKAQRYFIGGFEQVIGMHKDVLLNKVPGLLKILYDLDVLSEAAILAWGEKVSKKYVSKEVSQEIHDKAAPFITWLKEADTEESDSDEASDEEDLEIEYDDRAPMKTSAGKAATTTPSSGKKIKKASRDDDDDDDDEDDDDDGAEDIDIDQI